MTIFCFSALAQDGNGIEFAEGTHNFGEVKEEDGPITHEFEFTNTGESPIIISNVKASCGCTTPGWSKEPVMPGEKGFVKAQYNPRNRPGAFKKSLTITSNAANPRSVIYIQGKVIPRIKTVEEELRVKTGALRMKSKTVNMGRITTEKTKNRNVDIYNDSDAAITFNREVVGPEFISLSFEPATLEPKQKGVLKIEYDPKFENSLGFQNHSVKFKTNETEDAEKNLNIMATISEYFAPLTPEEKQNAPKLSIDQRIFDFGKMAKNTVKRTEFTLSNGGKSNLNIRKIVTNCNCVIAEVGSNDIKPGESTALSVEFDTQTRRGNQLKSVTIYSNDPVKPTQVVTIKASVEHTPQ
ncbi:MAG: DUF1573 domain-containing protein [Cyclobacteriaceae bacterium]